jgi:2-polyprenyl-6-methoxyphenol hydroxylase-like FAD-dependent oxidoreductase
MSAARRFAQLSALEPPPGRKVLFPRAVVLGGSIAGLTAARVLSDHADEVVIIERDDLIGLNVPDERLADPAAALRPRRGVPHGTQLHILLPAGRRQLERWLPGFTEAALKAGAVLPVLGGERVYMDGERRRSSWPDPALQSICASRPLFEALVRSRVLALPNVRTLHGRAESLVVRGNAVVGVRFVPVGAEETAEQPADFVVDCTGRSSRLADWLAQYDLPKPSIQRIPIKLNYATTTFRRPPDQEAWLGFSFDTTAPGRVARVGAVVPIEGNRWSMSISGYVDDRPSRDFDDYRQRCERDFPPEFGRLAATAEPAGAVATYHMADARRRDFPALDRFPTRLAVAGDAVASFNPVYGQGITSAALHASCLSAYLRSDPDLTQPAHRYFDDVRVIVDAAWQLSTTADLALPHITGPYPRGYGVTRRLGGLITKAAMRDPQVDHRLSLVNTMQAHPSTLSRPGFLLRVLANAPRR